MTPGQPENVALEALRWALEAAGGLAVALAAVGAVIVLIRRGGIQSARRRIAAGAIDGLTWKSAAALVRALELSNWRQITMFAAIVALRLLLKHVFSREFLAPARRV